MQDLHTLKICIKTEKFLDTDTSFNIQPYLEKPVPYMPVHEASRKKLLNSCTEEEAKKIAEKVLSLCDKQDCFCTRQAARAEPAMFKSAD